MKNVTAILPGDITERLRVRAAENGHIVSKWLASLVEGTQRNEDKHESSMERPLARKPQESKLVSVGVVNRLNEIFKS